MERLQTTGRRALLLASPHYGERHFRELPVARRDVARFKATLESVGFFVDDIVGSREAPLTRTRLLSAIRDFIETTPTNDTIIIYYSGHGIHVDGVDYLVPQDATFRNPKKYHDYFVPLDFCHEISASHAGTILMFIDACREGASIEVTSDRKSAHYSRWGSGQTFTAGNKDYALVLSCGPGEYSRYSERPDGLSCFTEALCLVFDKAHPASTFGEIRRALQIELDTITDAQRKPRQTIKIRGEFHADDRLTDKLICAKPSSPKVTERGHIDKSKVNWVLSILSALGADKTSDLFALIKDISSLPSLPEDELQETLASDQHKTSMINPNVQTLQESGAGHFDFEPFNKPASRWSSADTENVRKFAFALGKVIDKLKLGVDDNDLSE